MATQEEKDALVREEILAAQSELASSATVLARAGSRLGAALAAQNLSVDNSYQPDGTAEYKADYETGKGPWSGVQTESGGTVTFVDLPDGPAARAFVPPGGHRAELSGFGTDQSKRRMAPGVEKYLGQSILFPENYPHTQADYLIVAQIHSNKRGSFGGKQSAVHVSATNDVLKLRSNPNAAGIVTAQYTEPLRRDVWLHLVQWVRVGVTGMWAAWIRWDDEREYRRVIAPTSLDVLVDELDWAYWKTGVYSSANNRTDPHTVLHRLALSGPAFESVQR